MSDDWVEVCATSDVDEEDVIMAKILFASTTHRKDFTLPMATAPTKKSTWNMVSLKTQ